jgi:inner membrane protein
MDPLTHTLTGLALSRAGLNRLTAYATPILLIAANAADADILLAPFGATTYLHYHRHITHALIAIPVMAALSVLAVRLFARKKPIHLGWALFVALFGAASHPLLDWWNVYGIRMLLPFSDEWLRLDIVSLPDLWVWAILLIALIAPALSKLVSGEIGAKASSGRGAAITALVLMSLFVFGRWVLHGRAVTMLDARLYEGVSPLRVAAFPSIANPLAWTGVVDGGRFYGIYAVNALGEFDPAAGEVLFKTVPGAREQAAMEAAKRTEAFRVFLGFSSFPMWRFAPSAAHENGIRAECFDLRFGTPEQPVFVATAIVDGAGRVDRAWFEFRR